MILVLKKGADEKKVESLKQQLKDMGLGLHLSDVTDASLTVLISRLRSKICAATGGISCIHTRKGKGYYLE